MKVKSKLFRTPLLRKLSRSLSEGFVVGGFVRDSLLKVKKREVDVDLLIPERSFNPDLLAKELGASYFVIEKEKRVFTFLKRGSFRVDVTFIGKEGMVKDLSERDFTINAMAVPLREIFLFPEVSLVDPFKGYRDLRKKVLRLVKEDALIKDPIRVLRGVRFKVFLGFSYHRSFLRALSESSPLVKKVPPERVKEELLKVLPAQKFYLYLKELDRLKLLYEVFKELKGIEKIPPSGCHQFDLKTHTLLTVRYLESEAPTLVFYDRIEKEFPLLKLVALYHDVAKPLTIKEKNGYLTFYNHDKLGSEIVKSAFERLTLGKGASKLGWTVIRNHLRPFFLYDLHKKGKLSKRAVFRLYTDSKPYHFHLLAHSLADFCATSERMKREKSSYLKFLRILASLFSQFSSLKPLLSGEEIMEVKELKRPGPCVGRVKKKLLELQAVGKIKNREEAVKFVKGYCCG